MGEVVNLQDQARLEDDELIENLARFADGTLSMSAVKARHHLSEEEWTALASMDALVEKIEARKLFRLRGGITKKERAQIEIIDAPPILGGIMRDSSASPKHRIDSAKALDSLATGGSSEAAGAGAFFEITINLGADHIEHYRKSITPDASNPNDTDTTDVIAAIAVDKAKDDGGAKDIFERLGRGRLQQDKDAIEQQRRDTNPISRWAQECIDNDMVELDRGPYGVVMRCDLGTRIATEYLYGSYVSYCRRQGVRPLTKGAFGRACTRMFGTRQHVEDGRKRPRGYDVPTREVWQQILDGTWKQWRPLRPGEWMISPYGPTNY